MKTSRKSKSEKQRSEAMDARVLVGRLALPAALGVSLRTVDRMLAAEEITPIRILGRLKRFYLPDVVECLRHGDRNRHSHSGSDHIFLRFLLSIC